MGWLCSCGEGHDDTFETCWNCGRAAPAAAAGDHQAAVSDTATFVQRRRVPFELLAGERVIATVAGSLVIVTTHRVRSYTAGIGSSSVVSIMLDQVASCSVLALSKPILLLLAALSLFATLFGGERGGQVWVAGLIVAAILVLAYFLTRRRVVSIASAAAAINVDVAEFTEDTLRDVIHQIEAAKTRYVPVQS